MRTKLQIIAFAVSIVFIFQAQAQTGDATFPKGELSTVKNHTGNIWLKGDVIKCAPGVEHWHGAAPNSGFAYIAVTPTQKGKTIWLEPVTDKDYNGVK